MNHKEQSEFSRFIREGTPEEKEAVYLDVARKAVEDQKSPEPSVETTATEGEMVYEKAAPFHEPAQSVSQSPLPETNKRMGGWEEELDRISDPEVRDYFKSFIKERIALAHSEGFKEGVASVDVNGHMRDGYKAALEEAVGCVPEEKKECDCESEDGLGYHTKNCMFYPQGWNAARKAVLKALRDLLAQDISSKAE